MDFHRRSQLSLRFLFMLTMIIACGLAGVAQGASVEEFSRLTEPDQIEYLRQGLIRFREATRNISATVKHTDKSVVVDPTTGLPVNSPAQESPDNEYFREFDMRRIGDSYRIAARKRSRVPKEGKSIPESIESFDVVKNESRLLETIVNEEGKRICYGFISGQRSQAGATCFFYSYLGDAPDQWSQDDPGTWFFESSKAAKVASVDKVSSIVEATFPYPHVLGSYRLTGASGMCTVSFDLTNGAIPIRMKIQRRTEIGAGKINTYKMELLFSNLEQIGDVWIPTKMRAVATTSTSPGLVTVHDGTISNIKIGQLKDSDLEVAFPEGTEVVDKLSGDDKIP